MSATLIYWGQSISGERACCVCVFVYESRSTNTPSLLSYISESCRLPHTVPVKWMVCDVPGVGGLIFSLPWHIWHVCGENVRCDACARWIFFFFFFFPRSRTWIMKIDAGLVQKLGLTTTGLSPNVFFRKQRTSLWMSFAMDSRHLFFSLSVFYSSWLWLGKVSFKLMI